MQQRCNPPPPERERGKRKLLSVVEVILQKRHRDVGWIQVAQKREERWTVLMEILLKRKLAKVRRVNGSITVCGKVQTVWQKAVDRGSRRSMPTAVTKLLCSWGYLIKGYQVSRAHRAHLVNKKCTYYEGESNVKQCSAPYCPFNCCNNPRSVLRVSSTSAVLARPRPLPPLSDFHVFGPLKEAMGG